MSLKAKIEAVIYASEEPVTLAQLMGLLGEEAQLELDAREAEQPSLGLDEEEPEGGSEAGDADALNAEALGGTVSEEEAAVAEAVHAVEAKPAEATEATPGKVDPASDAAKPENAKALAAEARARERKLREYFREILDQLVKDYATEDRGLEVREVASGFRLATKPEYHDAVRGFVKHLKPPLKLSLQALETLAVVAYKQPVTAPEVAEIRGVDSGGVLGSLIARKLIQTAGRKQVIGRPMLYKTSKEFLLRFGLKDINELPSIEEFEKMAGEWMEPVQEEIRMEDEPRENDSEATGQQQAVSGEGKAAGGSPALDELNSAQEQGDALHESVEDLVGDKRAQPEGAKEEPAANMHEAQADGVPEQTENDEPEGE